MSLLLFWQAVGTPPVTGTATWEQALSSWSAVSSERFSATASFAQSASWAATAAERFTSTAAFSQVAAIWDAAGVERLLATADFVQTPAEWAATGQVLNDITGTAEWTQTASWEALTLERLLATVDFAQPIAAWDAAVNQQLIANPAAWEQPAATWDAVGQALEDILATGEWTQTAAWAAEGAAGTADAPSPPRHGPPLGAAVVVGPRQPRPRPAVTGAATFSQSAAAWAATAHVNDDALVLVLL